MCGVGTSVLARTTCTPSSRSSNCTAYAKGASCVPTADDRGSHCVRHCTFGNSAHMVALNEFAFSGRASCSTPILPQVLTPT
jgi:hypothetical protein